MKKRMIMVMVGAMLLLGSAILSAQNYQGLPAPYNAAPTAIENQQQYYNTVQRPRVSPSSHQFMTRQQPVQPQPYGAADVNGILLSPNYNGYVRPMVRTPMYQVPGRQ